MSGLIDRLKSVEALVAAVVATLTVVAKYTTFTAFVTLPEGLSGFAPHLSTLAVIVLTFVMILLSGWLIRRKRGTQALLVVGALVIGLVLTVYFAGQLRKSSVAVECADEPPISILEPAKPTVQLAEMIDSGGGLADAWCDHEDKRLVRNMIARENADHVQWLTFLFIFAEVMVTIAFTLGAWLVVSQNRRAG